MLIFCKLEFPDIWLNLLHRAFFPLSLIFKSQSSYFLDEVKKTSSVLPTFMEILFAFSRFYNFFRSQLTCLLMAITQLLKFRRLVSFAKWCTLEYLVATCKLLM